MIKPDLYRHQNDTLNRFNY